MGLRVKLGSSLIEGHKFLSSFFVVSIDAMTSRIDALAAAAVVAKKIDRRKRTPRQQAAFLEKRRAAARKYITAARAKEKEDFETEMFFRYRMDVDPSVMAPAGLMPESFVDRITELREEEAYEDIGVLIDLRATITCGVESLCPRERLRGYTGTDYQVAYLHQGKGKPAEFVSNNGRSLPAPRYKLLLTSISQTIQNSDIFQEHFNVHFNGRHLFTIKKSVVAPGWGLFAAMNFAKNRCIGVYHGKKKDMQDAKKQKLSPYSMAVPDGTVVLDAICGISQKRVRAPVYFGIHFANDADFDDDGKRRKRQTKTRAHAFVNNITVGPDFWVYTLHKIRKGEELLLDYNFDDKLATTVDRDSFNPYI